MDKMNERIGKRILASLLLWVAVWLTSCSTPMDVAYFQDAEALQGMALQAEQQFRLRPEDKINIIVNSSNPMLSQQFTLTTNTNPSNTLGGSVASRTTAGRTSGYSTPIAYTVDEQGTIDFPILGKITVAGKSRKEVAEYIQDRLIARELVEDPIVTVEYVNLGVNVLGEVNAPGHIDVTKDHFTIMDAIAYAHDLTINGNRMNVMVNRQVDGVNQVYTIDLTNMQSMLESPAYYLQQNDLVYVSPNDKRKRESQAIGNTFNTPGFWVTLSSLAVTVITLISTLTD